MLPVDYNKIFPALTASALPVPSPRLRSVPTLILTHALTLFLTLATLTLSYSNPNPNPNHPNSIPPQP